MAQRPAVSIIIPAYNGENYLRQCLDSVFAQTLKNIQVICINDGSTDSTAQILEEYRKDHQDMVVVTQENGGLSAARNAGLEKATGVYVDFLDCDDTLQADALERLYNRASHDGLDMLFYDGETIYETDAIRTVYPGYERLYRTKVHIREAVLPGQQLFVMLAESGSYRASACMYLLRMDFLKEQGFSFMPGVYYEDNVFTMQCLLSAQRAGVDATPYYKRTMRNDSIVTMKKDFRHARSYYICQNAMQSFLLSKQLDTETVKLARQQVASLMRNAVGVFAGLTEQEKETALAQYPDAWLICDMLGSMGLPMPSVLQAVPMNNPAASRVHWKHDRLRKLSDHPFNTEKPFVSVIMPVYNAEQYLKETIADLQRQTLQNFEIIFVDDGSTDSSCTMIEQSANDDPRIRLLRQNNCFAGVARNNGMAHAKGDYLIFLDSDDRFSKDLLLHAYARAEVGKAEVVLFHADILQMPQEAFIPAAFLCPCGRLPGHTFTAKAGKDHIFDVLNPWTKLYRRDYIGKLGIEYQALYSSNDLYFSMIAMACAERIAPLPEVLVHYRVGHTTNIQSKKSRAPLDVYQAFAAVKEELIKRQLFDQFRKPFAVKAAESMLRSLDTMTSLEGYRQLYATLHEGGMAYLEIDCIDREDIQHIKYGEMKLQRCRDIVERDYETFVLQLLTGRGSGTGLSASGAPNLYAQEISILKDEINALRSSHAFRIGSRITYPLHKLKVLIEKRH